MVPGAPQSPFLAALQGAGFGVDDGQVSSAADGLALIMLGVVFFVISLVAVFAWTMNRRARRPDPTLEFLAQWREEQEAAKTTELPATGQEPWERPADWWRKG